MLAIIGGGASGLAAAITAKRENPQVDVAIVERNERVGKKLLATGNGHCNYTNVDINKRYYHGSDAVFIETVLSRFGCDDAISFLCSVGVEPYIDASGRVYPHSRTASGVLDALRLEVDALGVRVVAPFRVAKMRQVGGRWELRSTDARRLEADAVIVAAGGAASPTHGTDGDALALLNDLGVETTRIAPALVGLTSDDADLKSLKGVRVLCGVSAECKGERLYIEAGEVIFNERGFSGIPILNASIRHAEKPFEIMVLDLLQSSSYCGCKGGGLSIHDDCKGDNLYSYRERCDLLASRRADEFFVGLLHKALARLVLKRAGISPDAAVSSLDDEVLRRMCDISHNLRFVVSGTAGFASAQATYGGVTSRSICAETLALQGFDGLYVCGEALDAVGDCGGYNLHWAWATGIVAGRAAALRTSG